uniref:Uncharacterized protein n=1 Tax=Anguilla anguilla TaxID=7936 RepID=A0A0E9VNS0_ANGAN
MQYYRHGIYSILGELYLGRGLLEILNLIDSVGGRRVIF